MIPDVAAAEAFRMLGEDADARLCDVRTPMEWRQVGVPALPGLGHVPAFVPWQLAPGQPNPDFLEELRAAGVGPQHHVYFICRSGARSMAAAAAAQAAGYAYVANVAEGFEGRPGVPGWAAQGLPAERG